MPSRFTRLELESLDRLAAAESAEQLQGTPVRDAGHHFRLAQEMHRWGRFEEGLQSFTRALREDRALIPAWVGQVQMLVELEEYKEARLWADKALELFRNQGDLLAAKAQACIRAGDRAAGAACCDAALGSAGSSAWRWEVRGEIWLATRQRRHDDCFEKALAEPESDWFDRIVIARIYMFYGQVARALRYLRQALDLAPDHGYNWFVLGQCQAALGWGAVAEQSFQHCLELAADYAPARHAIQELNSESRLRRAWRRLRSGPPR